jgi:hypothetical protein
VRWTYVRSEQGRRSPRIALLPFFQLSKDFESRRSEFQGGHCLFQTCVVFASVKLVPVRVSLVCNGKTFEDL